MKKFILIVLILFTGISVQAQEKKSKNKKVVFDVAGNCEMCKKRIETAAFSVKGVKSAIWDVEAKTISLIIDENKCQNETVVKAIAQAGHDNQYAKTSNKIYDALHGCCRYERKE